MIFLVCISSDEKYSTIPFYYGNRGFHNMGSSSKQRYYVFCAFSILYLDLAYFSVGVNEFIDIFFRLPLLEQPNRIS